MLFDNRRRVEEDLEAIRRRFLEEAEQMKLDDPDALKESGEHEADPEPGTGLDDFAAASDIAVASDSVASDAVVSESTKTTETATENIVYEEPIRATPKDILAMIIAVFSLILPFLLIMLGVMGLFLLFFFRNVIF